MRAIDTTDARDCFGYKNRRCTVLKSRKCEGIQCGFYKTNEEYELGRERALERINSLDDATRRNIIETYYGGRMDMLDI